MHSTPPAGYVKMLATDGILDPVNALMVLPGSLAATMARAAEIMAYQYPIASTPMVDRTRGTIRP